MLTYRKATIGIIENNFNKPSENPRSGSFVEQCLPLLRS